MRLLFVSGGIMVLGLIAVFAAIVYKLNDGGNATRGHAPGAPVSAEIAVPPGTEIVGTALYGGRALLTLRAQDGTTSLLLVDLKSGAVLGRYTAKPQ